MKKTILIALTAAGLSTAAFAQAPVDIATLDADLNGTVSLSEAQTVWPELAAEGFAAADVDASGELSVDELATLPAPAAPAM